MPLNTYTILQLIHKLEQTVRLEGIKEVIMARPGKSPDFINNLIQEYKMNPSTIRLARMYGMSDEGIRKILIKHNVFRPKGRGRSVKEMDRFDKLVTNLKAQIEEGTLSERDALKNFRSRMTYEENFHDGRYETPYSLLGITSANWIVQDMFLSDLEGNQIFSESGYGRHRSTKKFPISYIIERGRKRENDGTPRYSPEEFLEKYGPQSLNTEEDKAIMIHEAETKRLASLVH